MAKTSRRPRHLAKQKPHPRPAPLPPDERAAAKKMSKLLDSTFSNTEAEKRLHRHLDANEEAQRVDAMTQRKIVGDLYDLLLSRVRHSADRHKLLQACADAGIKITARTHFPLLLVRYELRDRPTKPEVTSRWASVLRQAWLDEIEPGRLTAHLGAKGHSIKAMAAKFTAKIRADKGLASRRPQLSVRCDEGLHEKLDRYCSKRPCWAQIEREKSGRFAIVEVCRQPKENSSSSSAE